MRTRSLLLALCAGTLMLAVAAPASATVTLGLSPGEDTLASSGNVSFTAAEVTVRCAVSLAGSFNGSIPEVSGEALGSVTSATASGCEGGERAAVTFLSTPWSLRYNSVSGIAPFLTAMLGLLNGVSVNIASGLLSCLYRGEVGLRFALSGSNPYPIGTISTLTNSLAFVSGFGCARTASITGSFRLTREQWLTEYAGGGGTEMGADPSRLQGSLCGASTGGCMVTFTNDTGSTITVTTTEWGGATGWSVTNNCGTILTTRSCSVTLTAGATTGPGQFRLLAGATIVGRVNLVPR